MKVRIKSREEIEKWLRENGYEYDKGRYFKGYRFSFHDNMFRFCGKVIDISSYTYLWYSDWYDKVEDDSDKLEREAYESEQNDGYYQHKFDEN